MISLAAFTVGSIGCALAADIWSFLVFRLLQAAITSCYPVSMAIIRDTAGEGQTASRIGYAAMIWALAPMIGPALGGVVVKPMAGGLFSGALPLRAWRCLPCAG